MSESTMTPEWEGGAKQFYVCQTFSAKAKGNHTQLVQLEMFHLPNIGEATRKAERIVENGRAIGAIAYSIVVDEDAGEYGDMLELSEFGEVPFTEA